MRRYLHPRDASPISKISVISSSSSLSTSITEDATLSFSKASTTPNRSHEFRTKDEWMQLHSEPCTSFTFSEPIPEEKSQSSNGSRNNTGGDLIVRSSPGGRSYAMYEEQSQCSNITSGSSTISNSTNRGRDLMRSSPRSRSRAISPPPSPSSHRSSFSAPTALANNISSLSASGANLDADVLIRVGGVEFWHSSTMLSYASEVLADNLRRGETLDIPHKSHKDWQALQAFLKPRSVQATCITPFNLPTLLPWFDQLALTVLLEECDGLLSSLEWPSAVNAPVVPSFINDSGNTSHDTSSPSCQELDRVVQDLACAPLNGSVRVTMVEREESPDRSSVHHGCLSQTDVADLLLLIRATGKAKLPHTRRTCLNIVSSYLKRHPQLFLEATQQTSKSKRRRQEGDLDLLHSLADILNAEDARKHLWLTVNTYLPKDLPFEQGQLVTNSLFPYLLREGLEKVVQRQRQEEILRQERAKADRENRCGEGGISGVGQGPCLDVSSSAEVSCSDDEDEDDEGDNWQDSFQKWWTSWNNPQAHLVIQDEISETQSDIVGLRARGRSRRPRSRSRSSVQPSRRPPQDRSVWLQSLWEKLQEPPIFPTTTSESDDSFGDTIFEGSVLVTPSRSSIDSSKRTFAC